MNLIKLASIGAMLTSFGLMDAIEHIPQIVEEITDLVEELDHSHLPGAEKFEIATRAIAVIIDDHCDWLPGWRELSESARDRITKGVAEIAVQISRKARGGKRKVSPFRLRLQRIADTGIGDAIKHRLEVRDAKAAR